MQTRKRLLSTAIVGLTLIGFSGSINAGAKENSNQSNVKISKQWKVSNQGYDNMLNGKATVYVKPEFKNKNTPIVEGTESSNGTYNHLKINRVIKTNDGKKYYQLRTQNNFGLLNGKWVKSNGVQKMNDSKKVTIHNSKQAARKVTDQVIPNNHKKDWRSQVDSSKNKDEYVVEVTNPKQTKKSGVTAVIGYYTVHNNGTVDNQQ